MPGDGDGSAAGADVDGPLGVAGAVQGYFDDVFGFGAGNQDGGGDAEGAAVEFLGFGDVLGKTRSSHYRGLVAFRFGPDCLDHSVSWAVAQSLDHQQPTSTC